MFKFNYIFSFFVGAILLFFNSTASAKTELEKRLPQGKWILSEEYPTSEDSDNKVNHYKTLTFSKNHSVRLDSLKKAYIGSWNVEGEKILLNFGDSISKTLHLLGDDYLVEGSQKYKNYSNSTSGLMNFFEFSGFANVTFGNLVMLIVGLIFIFLAIKYDYEPLLLIPIGTGIIIGNIPFFQAIGFNLQLGIYQEGSVLNYLYQGVTKGVYPPLIFLGIGAMTDFSSLISNPKLMLLGAAAQIGIFITFIGALYLGFTYQEAGAIGIIGGADGPTAIFISSILAKNLIGPIAIAAYSYMALVPVIQPPVMRLLITKKERVIKMRPPRSVSRKEKILFPLIGLLVTTYIAPSALPLLGMLFFGNLLKESTVTNRLAETARNSMIDIVTILLGLTVGASTQADVFLTPQSIFIFLLGAASFIVATAGGLLGAKLMNVFSSKDNKINPLIGAAGVSAVPDSARVVQQQGLKYDPTNHLLMHAMAPNVAGVIGSAVAAGILLSFLM